MYVWILFVHAGVIVCMYNCEYGHITVVLYKGTGRVNKQTERDRKRDRGADWMMTSESLLDLPFWSVGGKGGMDGGKKC